MSEMSPYITGNSVLQFKTAQEWAELLKSKSTKMVYSAGLAYFYRFNKVTPDNLIGLSTDAAKRMVYDYLIYLKRNGTQSAGRPGPARASPQTRSRTT